MDLKDQIKAAIGSHGLWKGRLRSAIDTGKSDVSVADARSDRNCAFGKWLQGLSSEAANCPDCKSTKELHAKFHQAAADVLSLAITGKKQEAVKAIGVDSQFYKLSAELTRALMSWSQTV